MTYCYIIIPIFFATCTEFNMTAILIIFILAYVFIVTEQYTRIDKAVPALIAGVLCWSVMYMDNEQEATAKLQHHFSGIAEILFFLVGAMTIVELIDAHKGFQLITNWLPLSNPLRLMLVMAALTFFLSAVLDNLTTAIVMCSISARINKEQELRWIYASLIVIAANAGGVWSPIGDVTTTMLWIGHRITASALLTETFIPAMISLIVPIIILWPRLKKFSRQSFDSVSDQQILFRSSAPMLWLGFASMLSVPILKSITGIPPFLAMMIALAVLWAISEFIDPCIYPDDAELKRELSIRQAMTRIEMPGILFFLGILLAVAALESSGQLHALAENLSGQFGSLSYVAGIMGLLSAVIDNVPLVAAAMNMYLLPQDDHFWSMLAYCAGTGGSILIIGSAAGVAAMGIEKISFVWYLKRISLAAFAGYLAGFAWFMLQR